MMMDNVGQAYIGKAELYESFRRCLADTDPTDPEAPYRSVYWSPSGGSTGHSQHVPVDAAENRLQRASLIPLLVAGGVYSSKTIDACLFDRGIGGFLYRAQEIFHDLVSQCQGTSLPLGWKCPDNLVVLRCHEFHANSISASPSRLAQLAGYVLAQLQKLQSQYQEADAETQRELVVLNEFRFRITRIVFACEPLHDGREKLLLSAFPRAEFASIIGGAEVGIWGVSLPRVMANDSFLYDERVVRVRVALDEDSEGRSGSLIITNNLRERFPVQNFDTGDIGRLSPPQSLCSDLAVLRAVEEAVRDASDMKAWLSCHPETETPERSLGCVQLISRASTSVVGQFNAYTHTLQASELIKHAVEILHTLEHDNHLGPFVNGQVVVWFQQDSPEQLHERVDIRLVFAEIASKDDATTRKISQDITIKMKGWIMATFSEPEFAEALSVTLVSSLEISDTASNLNKIPLLKDLRNHRKGTGILDNNRSTESFDVAGWSEYSFGKSSDGIHSHSAWMGAFQASPQPLWNMSKKVVVAANLNLEQELRRAIPPRLLERVPPEIWAPYPFAMTLPLYDGIIELDRHLRKAVKELLSPNGLILLRDFYTGVAGGVGAPDHVSSLLFEGCTKELALPPKIPEPIPLGERAVSSVDLGWSRTLLRRAFSSGKNVPRAPEVSDEEGDPLDANALEDRESDRMLRHFSSDKNSWGEGTDGSDSLLSRGLVFWRPDFLFDLSKVKRCPSCSSASSKLSCDCGISVASESTCPQSSGRTSRDGATALPPISICEINARFTINAFAITSFGVEASRRLFDDSRQQDNNEPEVRSGSDWSELGLSPAHRYLRMKELIKKCIGAPKSCIVWLVKGREKGYDCHAMEELLEISPVKSVPPDQLSSQLHQLFSEPESSVLPGGRSSLGRLSNKAEGSIDPVLCDCPSHHDGSSSILLIFLELHQDEIIKLPPSTLRYLTGSVDVTRKCSCRSRIKVLTANPLGAIYLLHDKRTLSLLGEQKLMERLVGSYTARVLSEAIISSVPISDAVRTSACEKYPRVRAALQEVFPAPSVPIQASASSPIVPSDRMTRTVLEAVSDPSAFVLKRSQSGKGKGMLFGSQVSRSTWLKTLFGCFSGSYILQPHVVQSTFPCILSPKSESDQRDEDGSEDLWHKPRACHVVGCLPFLGEGSFGPGIFRASPAGPYPVSVARRGAIILPALKMEDSSLVQQASRWILRSADCFKSTNINNEEELLASLRLCPSTWNDCGDCALREYCTKSGEVSVTCQRSCAELLFYSGVSVLACHEPDILRKLRLSSESSSWVVVSLPPAADCLSDAREKLSQHGICVWRANATFMQAGSSRDGSSSVNNALVRAVKELGGSLTSHYTSATSDAASEANGCCYVWDISPNGDSKARSHNAKAFPMHTDAAFERRPPTHLLMHTLSQDVLGGGLSLLLSGENLLRLLSHSMRRRLSLEKFSFQVPDEFKGNGVPPSTQQSILMTPSNRWRFRPDIVTGPEDPQAVRYLEDLLRVPSLTARVRLAPGSVLLLDNGRFFHARTEVLDNTRWLKRVRFTLEE